MFYMVNEIKVILPFLGLFTGSNQRKFIPVYKSIKDAQLKSKLPNEDFLLSTHTKEKKKKSLVHWMLDQILT